MGKNIKVSDLASATSLKGYYAFGYKLVNGQNTSMKLDLGYIQDAYEKTIEATANASEATTNLGGVVDDIRKDASGTLNEVRAKVDSMLDETGMRYVLSFSEIETGVLRYGDKDYKVYELTSELVGLPTTSGTSAEIVLSSQPLGDGLYLSVDCLSVSTPSGFVASAYKVRKIYLNQKRDTVVSIDCLEDIIGEPKALLTIRYVRGLLFFESFSFSVPLGMFSSGQSDGVSIEIPVLKYDKRLAFSYAMDDGKAGVYYHFFKYAKERNLCYTDGCGNDILFAFGNAWATYNQLGIDLHVNPLETNGMLWDNLVRMLDFGCGVYNHGGGVYDKSGTDKTDELAKQSLADNQDAIVRKTGVYPYSAVVPGGGTDYMAPFLRVIPENDTLYDWGSQSFGNYHIDASAMTADTLVKLKHGRINWDDDFLNKNLEGIKDRIREAHDKYSHSIYYCFSHTPGSVSLAEDMGIVESTVYPCLDWIHATYGKGGSDTIWMAPYDEIYEYLLSRYYSVVSTSVRDGSLVVSVKLAVLPNFRHKDVSLVIRHPGGIMAGPSISVSNGVIGLSYGVRPDGSLMINASLGKNRIALAEKYTAICEASLDLTDKTDATYMIGRLQELHREPFLERIRALEVPPTLVSVIINSGAGTTYTRDVEVNIAVIGPFTRYRVSETPSLPDVAWVTWASSKFPLTLSAGIGMKTVYVQVMNEYGESEIVSGIITLAERPKVTFTVTGRSNNTSCGSVLPVEQEVAQGGTANLTANATNGYVIDNWTGATLSDGVGKTIGTASVTNIHEDCVVTCIFRKDGEVPSIGKAVLSFGWDYTSPEVPNNGSVYDPDMRVTKVRLGSNTTSVITIFDVDGNSMGTFTNAVGFTLGNNTLQGNVTGDNSGRYPDEVLKRMLYKKTETEKAGMDFTLPNGRYRFKIFINTVKAFDLSHANYVLKCGETDQAFTLKSSYVDNFNDVSEVVMDVSGVVTFTMSTTDAKNSSLLLNAIEIERI